MHSHVFEQRTNTKTKGPAFAQTIKKKKKKGGEGNSRSLSENTPRKGLFKVFWEPLLDLNPPGPMTLLSLGGKTHVQEGASCTEEWGSSGGHSRGGGNSQMLGKKNPFKVHLSFNG